MDPSGQVLHFKSIIPVRPFHLDFLLLPVAYFHFDTSEYVTDTEWPFSLLHIVSRIHVFFHIWECHSLQVLLSRVSVGVQKPVISRQIVIVKKTPQMMITWKVIL